MYSAMKLEYPLHDPFRGELFVIFTWNSYVLDCVPSELFFKISIGLCSRAIRVRCQCRDGVVA